jgi:glycosyltransferase involved in cell wall biosynthesis
MTSPKARPSSRRRQERKFDTPKGLRILWCSASVTVSSGYATQSRNILYRMLAAGYPTAHVAFSDIEGGIFGLDGLTVYPRLVDPLGEDACIAHARDWCADVTFTLQDIWILDPEKLKKFRRWIPYVPIDSDPLMPETAERLPLAYDVVTYSQFGHRLLKERGFSSTYIPHGVDTRTFTPLDKREARRHFQIPQSVYLFGMVSANLDNPSRKGLGEVLEAFQLFHQRHPRSALFLHTSARDSQRGFPIAEYARALGLAEVVYGLPEYTAAFKLDAADMARLYSALDCLLAPSAREGFCLPIIEAQACGIPVIVNNTTSMPELVGAGAVCETGWKWWTNRGTYARQPDVRSLLEKMEEIYRSDREALAARARRFAATNYDMNRIFEEKWKPYLSRLERRITQRG